MAASSGSLKPQQTSTSSFRLPLMLGLVLLVAVVQQSASAFVAPGPQVDLDDPTGFFAPNSLHDMYSQRVTFDDYVTYGMRSVSLVAGFDTDLHRYDNPQQLIDSFERNLTYAHDSSLPRAHIDSSELGLLQEASELTLIENERNQAECQRDLDYIYERTLEITKDYKSFTESKRLDLIEFIDSFGSAPREQFMMGNTFWLGSYDQCRQARIDHQTARSGQTRNRSNASEPNDRKPIRGRYCVAQLRLPSWSESKLGTDKVSLGSESIKMGVCLPRSCNSISILRHSNRIESLIRLARLQQVPYSSLKLVRLFCLPDENSPLRQFSTSAKLFIGLISLWLLLVCHYSFKFELLHYQRNRDPIALQASSKQRESKLIQVFAFRHSWQRLFGSGEADQSQVRPVQTNADPPTSKYHENLNRAIMSAAAPAGPNLKSVVKVKILNSSSESNSDQPQAGSSDDEQPEGPKETRLGVDLAPNETNTTSSTTNVLNLAAIDGIKVISMIWLVSAHTMLFFLRNITNGRQFWTMLLDARFLTIMAGIFPVDSFFTATGVLCTYLKFNKSQESRNSLKSLRYWLETFVHRYLRFMPMYLLIFWYTRDLSEFIGQGPMWDYATADSSLRSICKRESLWVPVLFQANFKPIEQHCVKPAWYLANDYQYLLITPLFMLLLVASKWIGYLVLGLGVVGSLLMQFVTVYYQNYLSLLGPQQQAAAGIQAPEFTDFETLANFRPMFATYVLKDLWRLYVLPYNRIPPYLIGLLTGHLMYCYNKSCHQQQHQQLFAQAERRNSTSTSLESLTISAASLSSSAAASQTTASSGGQTQRYVASSSSSDRNKVDAAQSRESTRTREHHQNAKNKGDNSNNKLPLAVGFLKHHLNLNVWSPIGLLIAIIYLPMASKFIDPQEGERAKVGASLIIALMRLIWSLAVARLIYVCYVSTNYVITSASSNQNGSLVIDFLSSAKWKPWSKICLSVLLIQWEIIGYMAQVQSVQHMTFSLLLAFVIICIVASYAIGLLVYLVFEFPLSQIEQLYITPLLFASNSNKNDDKSMNSNENR